jgi:hypothetical protein
MWEEYFPNAEIIGIDIDEKCREFSGGRKRVLIGDQKDPEFIARLVKDTGGEFDIIIDDGEHSEVAILTSLQLLLPHVASHGIYAVEDLVDTPNVATCLHAIERAINYWPSGFEGKNWPYLWTFDKDASWLARNVTGVHFYRYLCLIQRGFNPEDNPYLHMESPPAA